jgi:5-methylcytosine-specific restriction endonuclease McrA
MDTLVLSTKWEPVSRVNWQRAVMMWVKGLVEIVEEYEDRKIRSVTFEIKMPSVVRYLRHRKAKRRVVRFSRENVFTRDRGQCQYCGKDVARHEATYDHVNPRAEQGKTTWENIVIACYECNQKKGGRTPEKAGMKLRSIPKQPTKLPDVMRITIRWDRSMPKSWTSYLRDVEYWNGELENDNDTK